MRMQHSRFFINLIMISTGMSWMCSRASPVRRSCPMLFLRYIFSLHKHEIHCSSSSQQTVDIGGKFWTCFNQCCCNVTGNTLLLELLQFTGCAWLPGVHPSPQHAAVEVLSTSLPIVLSTFVSTGLILHRVYALRANCQCIYQHMAIFETSNQAQ